MPAGSISNVITGALKDANLNTEERIVLAKVFRRVADALEKGALANELSEESKE